MHNIYDYEASQRLEWWRAGTRVVSPEISGNLFLFFRKIAGTILQRTFYHYKLSK